MWSLQHHRRSQNHLKEEIKMPKRKLTKEERQRIHREAFHFLGEAKVLTKEETEAELEKIRKKEEERWALIKKRQKKDEKRYKERAVAEATSLSYLFYEQEEAGPFQCPYCKEEPFDTRDELDKHIKKLHPKMIEEYIERLKQKELQQRQMNGKRRGAIVRLQRKRMKKLGQR